ncbi:uncharacterized protein LOC134831066 [Culicoides brevitarsis]|uniref:uncharacterized protein LOC134831066 n=1 Tax=Culicoides brevitarsis TaxID=469753 RepID=UPI00307BCEB0
MFSSYEKRRKIGQDLEPPDNSNITTSSEPQRLPSFFVQIPLEINQQYQNRKNNTIKSEVKFENHDSASFKTPTPPASTPTPPASSVTPDTGTSSLPSISTIIHGTSWPITSMAKNEESQPVIFKCELCPFISICEHNLNSHIAEHTQRKFLRKKFFCPGCDNVHYEKAALEVHLLQDHAMTISETNTLVEYVLKFNSYGINRRARGKGRISIKNATQLKKPDLLLETGQEQSNVTQSKSQPKIFVKSVQYLKRPEFCFNTESVPDTTNSFEQQTSSIDAFTLHTTEPTPPPFTSIFDTMQNVEVPSSYFDSNCEGPIENDSGMEVEFQSIPLEHPKAITTEPALIEDSPVKTCQSGKIYLKDISVLQDPRPMIAEETLQQPTIHLKTVDELNAMAINNLPSNFPGNYAVDVGADCFSNVNNDIINLDESDISDLIDLNNDDNYSQHSFTALLNNEFDNDTTEFETKKVQCIASSNMNTNNENKIEQNVNEIDNESEGMETSTSAKHRIYLATNLTNDSLPVTAAIKVINAEPKQKQGRPKGARQSGITQWRKNLPKNITEDDVLGPKCQIDGCALRFKHHKNMEYHHKCHTLMQNGGTICPECGNAEFKNWNSLHTHLWRTHNIDMELYACEKCSFKTPILARLKSEHMKTHSDLRGYKCGLCDKSFKNAKQLKHHVRMHRLRLNPMSSQKKPTERKCNQCPLTFPNTVALESHIIDVHTIVSENKLPSLPTTVQEKSPEKFKKYKHKCPECSYGSNDHNAFRRHKFQHSKDSLYKCSFCSYSSIQSTTYRKHIEKQHPDQASNLVFRCQVSSCTFTTISRKKYDCHVTNRHQLIPETVNCEVSNKPKIKVRKILTLTDPIHVSPEFFSNIESD